MRRFLIPFGIALVASAVLHAQPVRTFVATTGVDTNPCFLDQPCRTFTAALAAVAPGGEVIVLDSGGYGAVTIDKSVSLIAAPGIHAAVAASSGTAIAWNHGVSLAVIRGLHLQSHGASEGIRIDGATVHVERTYVAGFYYGLRKHFGTLTVSDSIFDRNDSGVIAADTTATIARTRFENNAFGLHVYLNTKASCIECFAGSNGTGFSVSGSFGTPAELTLERCIAANNVLGLNASANSTDGSALMRVSDSTASGNVTGIRTSISCDGCTAQMLTRGNNTIEGNAINGTFTGSFSAK